MSNLKNNLTAVIGGLSAELEKYGFAENTEFATETDDAASVVYEGEKGAIKLKGATVTFNPEYEVKVTVTEGTAKVNKVVYLIDFILPKGATEWEIEMK